MQLHAPVHVAQRAIQLGVAFAALAIVGHKDPAQVQQNSRGKADHIKRARHLQMTGDTSASFMPLHRARTHARVHVCSASWLIYCSPPHGARTGP